MSRRRLVVVAVVLLAGCSGLFGPAESGTDRPTTVTPVPVPNDGAAYPPGLSAEGVVFPDALADAHGRRIENVSYTLTSTRTVRAANGSVQSRLAIRVRLAADRTFHANLSTAGERGPVLLGRPPAAAEFWGDGAIYARALTRDNETVYNTYRPPNPYVGTWKYWIQTVAFGGQGNYAERTIDAVFDSVPTRISDRVVTDGTTVYRLVGTGAESTRFAPSNAESVTAVRLEATVTERGLVRSVRIRYNATVDGELVTVRRTFGYSAVGETDVGRPPWYDRAVDTLPEPTQTPTPTPDTSTDEGTPEPSTERPATESTAAGPSARHGPERTLPGQ